jgi:hypothetical protein
MVRRGSAVRVCQRACRKPCKAGNSVVCQGEIQSPRGYETGTFWDWWALPGTRDQARLTRGHGPRPVFARLASKSACKLRPKVVYAGTEVTTSFAREAVIGIPAWDVHRAFKAAGRLFLLQRQQWRGSGALQHDLTANTRHFPGRPLSVAAPRPANSIPEPATRSLTVLETRTSPGCASAAMRAPMWTARPPTCDRSARTRPCVSPLARRFPARELRR